MQYVDAFLYAALLIMWMITSLAEYRGYIKVADRVDAPGPIVIKRATSTFHLGINLMVFAVLLLLRALISAEPINTAELSGEFATLAAPAVFCIGAYLIIDYLAWEARVEGGTLTIRRLLRPPLDVSLHDIARIKLLKGYLTFGSWSRMLSGVKMQLFDSFGHKVLAINDYQPGYRQLYQQLQGYPNLQL
jgi:hypothetical protein